jgi:hypothetical protein
MQSRNKSLHNKACFEVNALNFRDNAGVEVFAVVSHYEEVLSFEGRVVKTRWRKRADFLG